jgi:hypothetical protein
VASPPVPSPPAAVPPIIILVRLGADFSPSTLRLAVGQQFELAVSSSVQATGPAIPTCSSGPAPVGSGAPPSEGSGAPPAGGPPVQLFAQCEGNGSYLFTAEQPGSVVLSATVRPNCAPGTMCPQWIAEPSLSITITPGTPTGASPAPTPSSPPPAAGS